MVAYIEFHLKKHKTVESQYNDCHSIGVKAQLLAAAFHIESSIRTAFINFGSYVNIVDLAPSFFTNLVHGTNVDPLDHRDLDSDYDSDLNYDFQEHNHRDSESESDFDSDIDFD